MNTKLNNVMHRAQSLSLITVVSLSMAGNAFAADTAQSPIDPSTLALFAIGLASLVATRKRVR